MVGCEITQNAIFDTMLGLWHNTAGYPGISSSFTSIVYQTLVAGKHAQRWIVPLFYPGCARSGWNRPPGDNRRYKGEVFR
jgi:hypothetical protein